VYGSRASLRWHQEQPNELWVTEIGQPAVRWTRGMPGLPAEASAAIRLPPGQPKRFARPSASS